MVHQLSLVSTIPHSKYVQTEATLQAFTGLLSPQSISTYTLVAKPNHIFKPKFEPGKVNQIEQYFMKCTTTWQSKECHELPISQPILKDTPIFAEKLFNSSSPQRIWTLQISDIPIAGKSQACCAQTIFESTLVHTHTNVAAQSVDEPVVTNDTMVKTEPIDTNVDTFDVEMLDAKPAAATKENPIEIDDKLPSDNDVVMKTGDNDDGTKDPKKDELDTKQDSDKQKEDSDQIPQENKKSSPQNLESLLQKTLDTPKNDSFLQFLSDLGYDVTTQFWIKGVRFFHGDVVIEMFKVFIRDDDHVGDEIKLKLLDESNTFQFKAYINIAKSTNVDAINQGTKSLIKLQEILGNLVKLEIPDRMYMDSRIPIRK
jgi:mediator of RNA polymerase II transcription subunit 18